MTNSIVFYTAFYDTPKMVSVLKKTVVKLHVDTVVWKTALLCCIYNA